MIRTDGRRTVAHPEPKRPSVEENADAFIRTLNEIRALPERKS